MPAIPVDSDRLGAIAAGHVEPVFPWVEGPDGKRRPGDVQERDEASGMPLWVVHILIAGGDRPELAQVRVPAKDCPAPTPLAPIAFERLVVNARVNRASGALATYWSAAGLADPRRQGQHKPQEQQHAA